jgi:hypothetical protein
MTTASEARKEVDACIRLDKRLTDHQDDARYPNGGNRRCANSFPATCQ